MQKRSLNIFLLVMINLSTILSIKNWPFTAEYGLTSLFYIGLAALFFFIPVALVSAELATGWPEHGGVFVWVKEAFGHKWGFLAVWLLWVENVVWYPTTLSFIAATLCSTFAPTLAEDRLFLFATILCVFWGMTLVNLLGMRMSGWMSSIGMIFGTLLPGVLIIALGMMWYISGRPSSIVFSWGELLPKNFHPSQLAFLAGVILSFAGMEMPAVHANDVENPQKNYPKAILISCAIIITLSVLGTLAIAIVIPPGQINLVSGGIDAIRYFLNAYGLEWSTPIFSLFIALGAIGALSTWIAGPSRALLRVAKEGDLPQVFHKVNRHDMPFVMLFTQGMIVSLLSLVFLSMPSVSSSFWILIALTSQLYLVMYFLLFLSALVLRYKHKEVKRAYRIPFGNGGMWCISMIGMFSSLFGIGVGFFPPEQLPGTQFAFYELFLLGGITLFCLLPFLLLSCKKESWEHKNENHEIP